MTAATTRTLLNSWIRQSHIGVIELASPSNRNALSMAMLMRLHHAILGFESDPNVRVMVLQAQSKGQRPVFSSGHDLREIHIHHQSHDRKALKELFKKCSQTMIDIAESSTPVIAKVNGVATAAGCQLVASCDLAYATTQSSFATPGVNLGLFCSTPAVAMGRSVASRKQIMEMLLTGQSISAKRAEEIGLINDAVPSLEELNDKVDNVVETILQKSPTAIRKGKAVFVQQMKQASLQEAYSITSKAMCENSLTDECKEGIDAFLNKRKPKW